MPEETTTIEITTEQRERLRELGPGSAKASLSTLLEVYDRRVSFDDVVAASEQGARNALEDHTN